MSLELVMNANGAIGHGAGSPISGGVFVITSTPSTKVKSEGAGVHVTPLAYTFSGGSASGFEPGTIAGGGTIPATAVKSKAESVLVMRLSDSATMNATGTPSGGGAPVAITGPVEVSDAGQSTGRAA